MNALALIMATRLHHGRLWRLLDKGLLAIEFGDHTSHVARSSLPRPSACHLNGALRWGREPSFGGAHSHARFVAEGVGKTSFGQSAD